MSALPNELSIVAPLAEHQFNAEANVLSADLEQPLQEKISPQASVKLPRDGQYQFSQTGPFHVEGILSYRYGYTQVAGYPSSKTAGFTTLSTAVLEGLNVLDVVTADRVVGQISTVHPVYGEGQVPSVTFLGTRFDNLRIDGYKVDVERDLDILGPKPDKDQSYFDDPDVQARILTQYDRIADTKNLPAWASKEFPKGRPVLNGNGELKASVVDSVKGSPGFSFGNVIDLPDFGKIFLGELKVTRTPGDPANGIYDTYKFDLTMIRLQMGCLAEGCACIVTPQTNGKGKGA